MVCSPRDLCPQPFRRQCYVAPRVEARLRSRVQCDLQADRSTGNNSAPILAQSILGPASETEPTNQIQPSSGCPAPVTWRPDQSPWAAAPATPAGWPRKWPTGPWFGTLRHAVGPGLRPRTGGHSVIPSGVEGRKNISLLAGRLIRALTTYCRRVKTRRYSIRSALGHRCIGERGNTARFHGARDTQRGCPCAFASPRRCTV